HPHAIEHRILHTAVERFEHLLHGQKLTDNRVCENHDPPDFQFQQVMRYLTAGTPSEADARRGHLECVFCFHPDHESANNRDYRWAAPLRPMIGQASTMSLPLAI